MLNLGVRIGCLSEAFQGEFLLTLDQFLSRYALTKLSELFGLANCWGQQLLYRTWPTAVLPVRALCPATNVYPGISSRVSDT